MGSTGEKGRGNDPAILPSRLISEGKGRTELGGHDPAKLWRGEGERKGGGGVVEKGKGSSLPCPGEKNTATFSLSPGGWKDGKAPKKKSRKRETTIYCATVGEW